MVYGTPAINAQDFNKSYVYFKNLPKVVSKINQLEKDLKIQIKNNE
jgi:UDP-3-O-[3-hydroxymyristoyl] glucosamine N-acyltransferase